ncbi:MAG: hypothetical protein HY718_04075, partial [Planctomycetes bacterium]|nr:hypothetical protein [Planctomycetota bacterium]
MAARAKFASLFVAVLFVFVSTFLAGCKDGGGHGIAALGGATTTINGQAIKGPLNGATVDFYAVNSNGTQGSKLNGTTITTDANGNYSFTPAAGTTGAVMIEVVGGSYVDELVGGNPVTVTAGKAVMSTMVGDLAAIPASVPCTPLTHIARKSAFEKMKKGTAAADAIKTAGKDIGKHFQLGADKDVTTIVPVPVDNATGISTTASADGATYGLMIAALIQQARDMVSPAAGVPIGADDMANFFDVLANDAKDGAFDGADATDLVSGGALTFTPTKTTGVAATAVAADKIQKAATGGMSTALTNMNTNFFTGARAIPAGAPISAAQITAFANSIGTVTASFSSSGEITGTVSVDTTVTSVENWTVFVVGFTATGDLDTTTANILAPASAVFPLTSSVKSSATGTYTITGVPSTKIGQNVAVVATKDIDGDGTITGDEDKERLVTVVPIAGSGSSTAPPCDRLRDNQFRVFQQQVAKVGDPAKADFSAVSGRISDTSTYGQAPIPAADADVLGNVMQAQDLAEQQFLTDMLTKRIAAGALNLTVNGVVTAITAANLATVAIPEIRKEKAKRFADFNTNIKSGMSAAAAQLLLDDGIAGFFTRVLGVQDAEFDALNAARNGAAGAVALPTTMGATVSRAIQRDNFIRDKLSEIDSVRDCLETVLNRGDADATKVIKLDLDGSLGTTDNFADVVSAMNGVKDTIQQAVDNTRAQAVFKPGADAFVLIDQAIKRAIEKFTATRPAGTGVDFKALGDPSATATAATSIIKSTAFANFVTAAVTGATSTSFIQTGKNETVVVPGGTNVTGWLKLVGQGLTDEEKGFEPNIAPPGTAPTGNQASNPAQIGAVLAAFHKNLQLMVEKAIDNDIAAFKEALAAITDTTRRAKVRRCLAQLIIVYLRHSGNKQNSGFQDQDGDGFSGAADPNDADPAVPGFQQFKDSDNDGVPDFIETQKGTDPFLATSVPAQAKDTDKDGMPDNLETFLGKDPLVANAFVDPFSIDRFSPLTAAGVLAFVAGTTKGDGIPDFVQDLDLDGFPSDMELGNGSNPLDSTSKPSGVFVGAGAGGFAPPAPGGTAPGGFVPQGFPFPPQKLRDASGVSLDKDAGGPDGLSDYLEEFLTAGTTATSYALVGTTRPGDLTKINGKDPASFATFMQTLIVGGRV